MDKPVAGVGNDTSTTPAPPLSDAPVEAEPSGMVTQAHEVAHQKIVQIDLLPFGTQTTRNQLPLRYRDMVK